MDAQRPAEGMQTGPLARAGPGLDCGTWNIHRARGADAKVNPARVLRALVDAPRLAGADLLVLTEADAEARPHPGLVDLAALQRATALAPLPGVAWAPESHGFLGVVVLLRPHLRVLRTSVIDLPGVCPRGAVVADLAAPAGPFRIVATHLSLAQPLRIAQMRTIGQFLDRQPPLPLLLAGDLNEWRPWGGTALTRRIAGRRLHGPALRTFPARWPLLPLDRILADRRGAVSDAAVLRDGAFAAASDHLPLVARVTLTRAPATSG